MNALVTASIEAEKFINIETLEALKLAQKIRDGILGPKGTPQRKAAELTGLALLQGAFAARLDAMERQIPDGIKGYACVKIPFLQIDLKIICLLTWPDGDGDADPRLLPESANTEAKP